MAFQVKRSIEDDELPGEADGLGAWVMGLCEMLFLLARKRPISAKGGYGTYQSVVVPEAERDIRG